MKQQLFLLVVALCSSQLMAAKSSADFFIEFNTMEEGHRKDWLNHCNNQHSKKTKMMENQLHDCVTLKNKHLGQVKKMMDCSAEAKDAKIAGHLDEAIKLHEKHKDMWKDWCDKGYAEAKNIAKRHDEQLEKFKERYQGKPEKMASMKGMEE